MRGVALRIKKGAELNTAMPQLVRNINEIADERDGTVLMLRFGDTETFMSAPIKRKRHVILNQLDQDGYAYEPCGAPLGSGWMTYLGDVALEIAFQPGGAAYETLRAMFEDDLGERIDPDVGLCVFLL